MNLFLSAAAAVTIVMARLSVGAMLAVTLVDVVGRNLGVPLPGASEVVSLLLGLTFFAGVALAGRDVTHISIGAAIDYYPKRWTTAEAVLTRVVSTLSYAFIAWLAAHQAKTLYARGVRTEFLNLPLYPIVSALALLGGFAVVFCAAGRGSSRVVHGSDTSGDDA